VCFGTTGVVLCRSRDVEIRMLVVCILHEENRTEMKVGRRDIYPSVLPCASFDLCCILVNVHNMAQP